MAGKPLASVLRLRWFKEARFGMFIHWGLYSQLGWWEWTMHNERIPIRDGESIHYFGPGRASGVPIIAGLIMEWELRAGHIDHRLAFCSPCSALGCFIHPPAIWTDGPWSGGIPEGAVVQLDPALNLDRFSLSPGARVVARALQEYGAVNTDTGGTNALYGEGLWAHPGRSWDGLLAADGLMAIPLQHYRVLRLDGVNDSGMHHRHSNNQVTKDPP